MLSWSITKPRFIKIPESKNLGNMFITGNPLNHKSNWSTAVRTAACAVVLPASTLKVVNPGECDPITVPQQPAAAEAKPVHFTSSSTLMVDPVDPSIPAMRKVRDNTNTKPKPKKVATLGGSKVLTGIR